MALPLPQAKAKSRSRPSSPLLEAWPEKCAFVVNEILRTEEDYVDYLREILEGYLNPLRTHLQSSSDGEQFLRTVFCNIDRIHNIHYLFLQKLKACSTDPHEFGEVFATAEDDFEEYTDYCTNHPVASETLMQAAKSKEMMAFLGQCQRELCHSMPLGHYLIKPVQRIMKYHLLLQNVVKHFERTQYGYASLQRAQGAMQRVTTHVNEVKRQRENKKKAKLVESSLSGWKSDKSLSAYGELLLEGFCRVGKKKAEREVLLFEKLLLILKKKDAKRYVYKGHILKEEMELSDFSGDKYSFVVSSSRHRHQSYLIQARTTYSQQEWVKTIGILVAAPVIEETEYSQQKVKRRRTEPGMTSHVKETREPKFMLASSYTWRLLQPRRRKTNIVSVLPTEQDEGAPTLLSVSNALLSITKMAPEEPPIPEEPYVEPPEAIPTHLLVETKQYSKSQESLLSLSDVEVGMEEQEVHMWMTEEVDAPHPVSRARDRTAAPKAPPRRKSQLKRKAAIRIKQKLNSPDTKTLARLAREASRLDRDGGQVRRRKAADRQGKSEDEDDDETPLHRLIGHPSAHEDKMEVMDQDFAREGEGDWSEHVHIPSRQSSKEPIELGAVGGVENGYPVEGGMDDSGPPVEIVVDGEVLEEEGVEPVARQPADLDGSGIHPQVVPDEGAVADIVEGEEVSMYVEKEGEGEGFVIMEGSSDSEDEEEEGSEFPAAQPALEQGQDVLWDDGLAGPHSDEQPLVENGDMESGLIPGGTSASTPEKQPLEAPQLRAGEEVTRFFESLSERNTPEPEVEQQQEEPELSLRSQVFQFKGAIDTYATMPRKPRHKPKPTSTAATAADQPAQNGQFSTSTFTLTRGASRKSSGFSRLLEFTKRQSIRFPKVDMSQSLPIGSTHFKPITIHPEEEMEDLLPATEPFSVSFPESELQQIQGHGEASESPDEQVVETVTEISEVVYTDSEPTVDRQGSLLDLMERFQSETESSEIPTDMEAYYGTSATESIPEAQHIRATDSEMELPEEDSEVDEAYSEVSSLATEYSSEAAERVKLLPSSNSEHIKHGVRHGEYSIGPQGRRQLSKRVVHHPVTEEPTSSDTDTTIEMNGTQTEPSRAVMRRNRGWFGFMRTGLWGCVPCLSRRGAWAFGFVAVASFIFLGANFIYSFRFDSHIGSVKPL